MKISKKDLRRLIREAAEEEAKSGGSWKDAIRGFGQSVMSSIEDISPGAADSIRGGINAVEKAVDSDLDGDGDTGEKGSKSSGKKITPREETKYIQGVIDPEAKHTKADGQWGRGTNTAWKEWVTSDETIERIKALQAKAGEGPSPEAAGDASDPIEESIINRNIGSLLDLLINEQAEGGEDIVDFVNTNKGSAGKIAARLGYEGNITGVNKMVRDLQAVDLDAQQKAQEPVPEPEEVEEEDDDMDLDELLAERELNTKIQDLSIPAVAEYFKMKGAAFTSKSPRRTIDIDINNPDTWKGQTKYITDTGELKIFKEGEIDTDENAGKVMKKMFFNQSAGEIIISKAGRDIKIFPVKLEDGYVVADKKEDVDAPPAETEADPTNESLSRGALIRKRYYGRY